jgi:hypothetical protein
LSDPRMHEMTVAGTTSCTLFQKLPRIPITPSPPFQARSKLSSEKPVGNSHMRLRLTWSKLLKLVISSR